MSVEDVQKDLTRIKENCELLVVGWSDEVEYFVKVAYHDKEKCTYKARSVTSCGCRLEQEARKRHVRRPGLMEQLENFKEYQDTNREPQAERAAPRVKKIKQIPELGGFYALDEISCDVAAIVDRSWEEAGLDRSWAAIGSQRILGVLPVNVKELDAVGRPDLVHTIARATDKWVGVASRALRLVVSDAALGDTVCGNCGGGLAVPHDVPGDGTDGTRGVRCVGKPGRGPCGEVYPMSEWVALYEGRART